MSALMQLDVSDDADLTVRVPVTMRTVLKWEQGFPNRSMAQFSEGTVKATYLYELAFLGFQKATGYANTFEVFSDSYDVTPVAVEVPVPLPTVPAV